MIAALPLVALLLAPAVGAKPPAAKAAKAIKWESSFAAAVSKAKATRKPIMIDFWAEWCGYCHQLDRTTYKHPDVVRLAQDFISVKVNTEGSESEVGVAVAYLVRTLPTMVFLSPEGRPFMRLNGFVPGVHFAKALDEAKRRAATLIELEAVLAKDPQDPKAVAELGIHQFGELQSAAGRDSRQMVSKRLYEDTTDLLTRARKLDAGQPPQLRKRVRVALGLLYGYKGKFEESEKVLKEALSLPALPSEDARAYLSLAELYLMQEKEDAAVNALKTVVGKYAGTDSAQAARLYMDRLGIE
jgi:thioredoxin-like negative regulator of GroEL